MSFNFLHLSSSSRVISIGISLSFFSLFLSWFSIADNSLNGNAFSIHVGYIGYIIILINSILCFLLLSGTGKEKIKTKAHMTFSDHTIIIASGVTLLLLTLVIFNSIRGFVLFYQNIVIGDGIVFQSIGSIFIAIGGLLYYREKKRDFLSTMYVENTGANDSIFAEYEDILGKNDPDKKNMTLPL
ncbi:MAG: hypothetical protein PHH16_02765 [Candidatus Gracilibacteria bacterium]|jgi:hypothetical protein|nr:hypothetical protein [Candidatus Gracilibacteria bacterium]